MKQQMGVTISNPLPGYGDNLTDEMILGYICWYTITTPKITHERMIELVTDLQLDPFILPNPPRRGDAFKRACRYSEQNGLKIIGSENRANILIRSVANTATEIERHMVVEIVDPEGRQLEYIDAAHLKFDRAKSRLHVGKRQNMETSYDNMVVRAINIFNENFEDAAKHIDAQVIRRMIRDQLTRMGAISVRRQGSVYFYPQAYRGLGIALEEFCRNMGPGSDFHNLPLVDTTKQRDMVSAAFQDEVHERAVQIMAELETYRSTKKKITIRAWTEYRQELQHLSETKGEYTSLVSHELSKADTELGALQKSLEDFLASGLVKT